MMASSNASWGIEIGAGGVHGLKLVSDGDQARVVDFLSFDHPKVLSTPELDQDDAMRVAVGMLASRFDLSNATIAISVPGHQSFARFAKLPPVEPKKVPDIVKFEAVQQIPFPLEDVEWDYQTFVSPDSPEIEVGIFAITRQRIMERLTLLEDVGITPDVATLSPIAVYNAFAHDLGFTEKTVGTILLDIGTTASDLVIAHAGRVWVRTFPIGGHQFTEALVETFKLPYSKAEKLKREAEQSKHARHVFQAMRPVFTDLVQEVQRSIGYYQSLHPNSDLKRLIGVGSTFKLPGLRKYLKQQLQMDVYRLEQFKQISLEGPRAGEFQAATLNLATAYGLALQGLGMATLEANLMPVKLVREAMWKRKVAWFGAAAAVAAVASASMFIRPMLQNAAVTKAGTPAQFQSAINDANAAKGYAQNIGALGDGGDMLEAEQMIEMLDAKEIYGHIVRDIGEMLAQANAAWESSSAENPAFTVNFVSTEYRPGKTSEKGSSGSPFGGRDEEMGSGEFVDPGANPFMVRGGPTPGANRRGRPGMQAEPEEVQDVDRIVVEMQLTTSHPDAFKFVLDTIDPWLKQNGKRAGVPYEIWLDYEPWRVEEVDASALRPGGRVAGRTGPRVRSRDEPMEFVRPDELPGAPKPVPGVNPVTDFGSRDARGSSGRSGPVDLEKLAPLVPAEEGPAPTAIVTVRWYVLLQEPSNGEGGES